MSKNRGDEHKSNDWLVSFGDLLTLLLCFFISLIALSPPKIEQLFTSSESSGTQSASQPHIEALDRRFVFSSNEVNDSKRFVAEVRSRLEKAVDLKTYDISTAKLEICYWDETATNEEMWLAALGRSIDLKRHLLDTIDSDDGVAVRIVGPLCNVLRQSSTEEEVAAVLTISLHT